MVQKTSGTAQRRKTIGTEHWLSPMTRDKWHRTLARPNGARKLAHRPNGTRQLAQNIGKAQWCKTIGTSVRWCKTIGTEHWQSPTVQDKWHISQMAQEDWHNSPQAQDIVTISAEYWQSPSARQLENQTNGTTMRRRNILAKNIGQAQWHKPPGTTTHRRKTIGQEHIYI